MINPPSESHLASTAATPTSAVAPVGAGMSAVPPRQPNLPGTPGGLLMETQLQAQSMPMNPNSDSSAHRPLNVKDALLYLDEVKLQFAGQPEVYNKFLDIMKEFKSQNIDTPGVIDRVSTLFKGHPSLISGFNTFLPPGYRIEPDPHSPDIIRVTTPKGATQTHLAGPMPYNSTLHPTHYYHISGNYSHSPSHGQLPPPPPPPPQSVSTMSHSAPKPLHPSAPITSYHGPSGASQHVGSSGQPRGPVEFDYAINYVNKIKNRFSNDPETYKQFLEILQTYQKEQKPIQEVYAQVQILFNSAPDLLSEFKQFLPELSAHGPQLPPPSIFNSNYPSQGNVSQSHFGGRFPPVGNFTSPGSYPATESHRNGTANMSTPGSSAITSGAKKKGRPSVSDKALSSTKKQKRSKHYHKQAGDGTSAPSYGDDSSQPPGLLEETQFFEQAKRHINNKQAYHEFLKVINRFSQNQMDQNTLMINVSTFIGDNQALFDWFKSFVGYEERDVVIENTVMEKEERFVVPEEIGTPSYRLLAPEYRNGLCSGRDDLCKEVLNNDWAVHPSWTSANQFIFRKNQFELALHKCEDERYEHDLNIEANLNTIGLLEPIAKKIATMTPEERGQFKLPEGLGGPSRTIYQRIIKKIYGNAAGLEIIDALHNNPAVTVPVVLKRLRQKDEEWKRSQREWNKVWREIDSNNYYRALDNQGSNIKFHDSHYVTDEALLKEIENAYTKRRVNSPYPLPVRDRPHIVYTLDDTDILALVQEILILFADKDDDLPTSDRERVKEFLNEVFTLFLDRSADRKDTEEGDDDEIGGGTIGGAEEEYGRSPASELEEVATGRIRTDTHDYRREALLRNYIDDSGALSDQVSISAMADGRDSMQVDDADMSRSYSLRDNLRSSIRHLFSGSLYYCLIRYIQIIYSRLQEVAACFGGHGLYSAASDQTAVGLGVLNRQLNAKHPDASGPRDKLIHLLTRYFQSSIGSVTFEERLRDIFGNRAYCLYYIRRIVENAISVTTHIIGTGKEKELWTLFEQYRSQIEDSTCPSHIERLVSYRRSTEKSITTRERYLYHIQYIRNCGVLTVQLLDRESETVDKVLEDSAAFNQYLNNYVLQQPTETKLNIAKGPFLKRTLSSAEPPHQTNYELAFAICPDTYRIAFIAGGEDFFITLRPSISFLKKETDSRVKRWRRWRASRLEEIERRQAEERERERRELEEKEREEKEKKEKEERQRMEAEEKEREKEEENKMMEVEVKKEEVPLNEESVGEDMSVEKSGNKEEQGEKNNEEQEKASVTHPSNPLSAESSGKSQVQGNVAEERSDIPQEVKAEPEGAGEQS
ncbi:uncharacterized protein VTP21DRAFT_11040 [Calcarisporiella thermophila]|uniref:uncharacterized protein n=1 Tax=Calcarisporiella thermophila TaxID=911321 RepID=UPI003743220A